jgi:AbrB family looped-hinge helix DNA binding protein
MKSAIELKIDPLGRITIPSPYRKALGMHGGEKVKMQYKDNKLVVWKPTKTDLEMYIDKLMIIARESNSLNEIEYMELKMITEKLAKEE